MSLVDYEINKELGECYLFMGELEKAHEYYTKAVSCNENVPDPYLGLAAVAVHQGSLEEARKLYSKALEVGPGEKPLTGLGMVEMELGFHEEAFSHLTQVLDINPGNMMVLNSLLQLAYAQSRLEDILPYMTAALDAGDTEAVRYALAACLLNLGREEEAKSHLELLLGQNPTNDSAKQLYAQLAA